MATTRKVPTLTVVPNFPATPKFDAAVKQFTDAGVKVLLRRMTWSNESPIKAEVYATVEEGEWANFMLVQTWVYESHQKVTVNQKMVRRLGL